jgi:hypothetical protein
MYTLNKVLFLFRIVPELLALIYRAEMTSERFLRQMTSHVKLKADSEKFTHFPTSG